VDAAGGVGVVEDCDQKVQNVIPCQAVSPREGVNMIFASPELAIGGWGSVDVDLGGMVVIRCGSAVIGSLTSWMNVADIVCSKQEGGRRCWHVGLHLVGYVDGGLNACDDSLTLLEHPHPGPNLPSFQLRAFRACRA
jgi:hypothetical protein